MSFRALMKLPAVAAMLFLIPADLPAQQGLGVGPLKGGVIRDGKIRLKQLPMEMRQYLGSGRVDLPMGRGCTAYEHNGFAGASRKFVATQKVSSESEKGFFLEGRTNDVGRNWDDRISSVRCDSKCAGIFYFDRNLSGGGVMIMPESPDFGYHNDTTSSVLVVCS